MVSFDNNKARQIGGHGVGYFVNTKVMFEGNVTVKFDNNMAEQNAGVLYSKNSNLLLKGNSNVTLTNNKAILNSGALYFEYNSNVTISEFTNITLNNNRACYGGGVLVNNYFNISSTANPVLLSINNEVTQSGGDGYFDFHYNFIIKGNANVTFEINKALHGGAVCFNNNAKQIFKENSTAFFYRNFATVSGGAVSALNISTIALKVYIMVMFTSNNAQYGGAIFLDKTQ